MASRTRFITLTITFCVCSLVASILAAFEVHGAIAQKWQSLGGVGGFLRQPLTNETTTPDGVGRFNHFEGGSIYWTPATEAHEVHGYIRDKWASLGWERSELGYPISDELDMGDKRGRLSNFQAGTIYWSDKSGAHLLRRDVKAKWILLKGSGGFLGYPIEDESPAPDKIGRYAHFEGGSIYWSPTTGAHEVHGDIRDKWQSLGSERSFLRYPISDETDMHDGRGRFSDFQGGTIYWSDKTGAHSMYGQVKPKWIALGGARTFGYPTSDESLTPDQRGHYVHFELGSIYWTAATGAHEVHGNIRDKWESLGWERGPLGYPISDEFQDGAYRRSNFQHGFIRWSAETGAVVSRSGGKID